MFLFYNTQVLMPLWNTAVLNTTYLLFNKLLILLAFAHVFKNAINQIHTRTQ